MGLRSEPQEWESAMVRAILLYGSLIALGLVVCGCGPDGPQRAEVSGTVNLDGEPVAEGAINFFPTEGTKGPEAGTEIRDGKFHINRSQGPVVGRHRIVLTKFGDTGQEMQDPTKPPGTMMKVRGNVMPPQFGDNSTLVREVKPSGNKFEFDISSKE
jgi:hypothetical protein